jgi:Sec7-like guanine-nucleotide exchange factor
MLLISEGLSKEKLGQYFGNENPYNQNIFISFCNLLDFHDNYFDDALRLLLSRFKLPGEA